MNSTLVLIRHFIDDQEALTVVEYVVAAALLVGAMTVLFTGFEVSMSSKINDSISSAGNL